MTPKLSLSFALTISTHIDSTFASVLSDFLILQLIVSRTYKATAPPCLPCLSVLNKLCPSNSNSVEKCLPSKATYDSVIAMMFNFSALYLNAAVRPFCFYKAPTRAVDSEAFFVTISLNT